ncbi:MAG: hypothetical protein LBK73_08765 [Treponema sp.]|jgi:hypothetical protein|nr:hypothetical protein [Treponema sp.]
MIRTTLRIKKSSLFALRLRYGMLLQKGGVKYRKFCPGDWRLKSVSDKMKHPASLKDNIHKILYGDEEEKALLRQSFFHIADTPKFMKDMGLNGQYFSVRYGVISRHMGKDKDHQLSEKNWLDLIDEIVKPFAIAKYGDGYRLFTSVRVNDKYTVAGVDVKTIGRGIRVNSVTTAFGYNPGKIEKVIYRSEKTTLDQEALLKGLNSPSYPPDQGRDRR